MTSMVASTFLSETLLAWMLLEIQGMVVLSIILEEARAAATAVPARTFHVPVDQSKRRTHSFVTKVSLNTAEKKVSM